MTALSAKIRLATADDLPAINDIYNHYVIHCTCTYQEVPSTMAERTTWLAAHDELHPITVAVDEGERVVGWGALNAFHPRSAYRFTVENSVYIHPEFQRRGWGRRILGDLLIRAEALRHHSVLAIISADQSASVALHERMGFQKVGHMREVGLKFTRWLDVIHMQWIVPPRLV